MVNQIVRGPLMLFPMPPGVSAKIFLVLHLIPRGVPRDTFGIKKEKGNEFRENVG